MNIDSIRQWNPRLRPTVRKIVFKPIERIDVDVREIDSREKIKQLCIQRYGLGTWIVRGFSGAKNSHRVKQVRLAKVTVRKSKDGYRASIDLADARGVVRLSRYWFFHSEEKHGNKD